MRFLVDECVPTRVAVLLTNAGHDAIHALDCGLAGAPDEDVLRRAVEGGRVLISADTDFGGILARSRERAPSVILFRRHDRLATSHVAVLLANLDAMADDLEKGAFIVITDDKMRIRALPFQ
ncbi:DUF5615 family PIN-like protein [Phytohabitans kaempferiae]|uniref:DUF5615 family PIN-like protein n=1 Tax=Phytohabitans kaempferiae TaxID=1620943 RepID=A0ABV6LVX1_9ACTN